MTTVSDRVGVARARAGTGVVAIAALAIVLAACGGSGGNAAPTFQQDGYTVTCEWSGSAVEGQGGTGSTEALSFCRSRAREAAGTATSTTPTSGVQSVTIKSDGSATVCYGAGGGDCHAVLAPLPG
jgi:hypothetical protein